MAGDVEARRGDRDPTSSSLVHDTAFFNSIKSRGFHGGLLDGLARFYS
jgi:hypothetical protein